MGGLREPSPMEVVVVWRVGFMRFPSRSGGWGGVGGVVAFLLGQDGAKERWVPLQLMHLAGEISQQFSRGVDAPLHEATGQRWSWSLWGKVHRGQGMGDLHPWVA